VTGVAQAGASAGRSLLAFAACNGAMVADAAWLPIPAGSYLAAVIFVPWALSGVLSLFWLLALAAHVRSLHWSRAKRIPRLPGAKSLCPCGADYCPGCRRGRWLSQHR
jgi:hypothetical protein